MKRFSKIFTASAVVASMLIGGTAYAATASMSLTPGAATRYVGSTFSMSIYENSGAEPVNVAEAALAFDGAQLRLTGIACGPAFEIAAPGAANGISCGTVTPKTGSQLVGTATFKTLAGSGTGTVNINGAHVYSANDNTDIANGTTGASITFAAPVAAVAPTPAPVVVAPVVVEKTYVATVVVEDKNTNFVSGAKVALNGKTFVTDGAGRATFSDLKAGTYDVTVSSANVSDVKAKIIVSKANQKFLVTVANQPVVKKSHRWFIFGAVVVTLTGIGGAAYVASKRFSKTTMASANKAKVITPAVAATVSRKSVSKKAKTASKKIQTA